MKFSDILNESSWTRIWRQVQDYDIALISAFRNNDRAGRPLNKSQNRERNRKLKAALLSLNYGITDVFGSWLETIAGTGEEVESAEESFFVVNLPNDPRFAERMDALSTLWEQDAFLIKMKGKNPELIGTNETCVWIKKGEKKELGDFHLNKISQNMTRIGNASFVFDDKVNKMSDAPETSFAIRKKERMMKRGLHEDIVHDMGLETKGQQGFAGMTAMGIVYGEWLNEIPEEYRSIFEK